MTATADLEVVGLKEALKTLNKLNPTVRRTITKDFKKITQPVVTEAQSKIPQMPLSGFKYNWTTKSGAKLLPWDNSASSKQIKSGVSAKKPRQFQGRMSNASVIQQAGFPFVRAVNVNGDVGWRGLLVFPVGHCCAATETTW